MVIRMNRQSVHSEFPLCRRHCRQQAETSAGSRMASTVVAM